MVHIYVFRPARGVARESAPLVIGDVVVLDPLTQAQTIGFFATFS
jgi:hypothetical protein